MSKIELRKKAIPKDRKDDTLPQDYVVWDDDMVSAANVALVLGKPLLLTGDPGVGKSEFSRWLAYEMELGEPESFVVKSTTEANDLFYRFDALGRFHDAQISVGSNPLQSPAVSAGTTKLRSTLDYISYEALGRAILYSQGREYAESKGLINASMDPGFLQRFPQKPRRSVVLIDEIDKAQRDVPNDILDEIDKMVFTAREIGNQLISAANEMRPIVVITSNSERDLPEPFLRRCVYYDIAFPTEDGVLEQIVQSRLGDRMASNCPLVEQALQMLKYLRSGEITLDHKPGTAELLDWLYELSVDRRDLAVTLANHPRGRIAACATLFKHKKDQQQATERAWKQWLERSQNVSTDSET